MKKHWKNYWKKILLAIIMPIATLPLAFTYAAIQPTVTVSNLGNNEVQVNVYGDANATVYLYFTSYNSNSNCNSYPYNTYPQNNCASYNNNNGAQSMVIGTTNSNGYLTTTLNASSYGVYAGAMAYVLVDGLQSQSVLWPVSGQYIPPTYVPPTYNQPAPYYPPTYPQQYYPYQQYQQVSLSQTSVTMSIGQNLNLTMYGSTNGYGIFENTGTYGSVTATVNGSILNLVGNVPGSATVLICSLNSGYNQNGYYNQNGCASLYVTVAVPYTYYQQPYYQSYQPYQPSYPVNYYPPNNYQQRPHSWMVTGRRNGW